MLSGRSPLRVRGVTMVELVVVFAIVGILAAVAVPNFRTWIQNTQIRNAAESIQNGLQVARIEAVRRNSQVGLWLTTTIDATCAVSVAGPNWVVSFDNPAGLCANAYLNETFAADDAAHNPAPRIIQLHAASDGAGNAVVASTDSQIVFNGMGRLSPASATNKTIAITNPTGGACAPTGSMRCMNVIVTPNGQVRTCDPAIVSTDPRGC